MTKTHATGAAASYGSRYLLKGIFNVAVGEDDDDGNAAEGLETISQIQAAELVALCDEVGADKRAFCEYFKIGGIAMMPVKDFNRAKTALNSKRRKG